MNMFPCCGYDPGLAAYLAATEDTEHQHAAGDKRLDWVLHAVSIAALGLSYGLLFMVT
jgi:hypothetical protein